MAHLPVLGPEGPPPIKRSRTDSDSDTLGILENLNNQLPEDIISVMGSDFLNNTETSSNIMSNNSTTPNQQVTTNSIPTQSPSSMGVQMPNQVRTPGLGGMTGPIRVMPNQTVLSGIQHQMPTSGMGRPGMGMGGGIRHQPVAHGPGMGMGQLHMASGPQYMHPHHPGGPHHAMHPMSGPHMINPHGGIVNHQHLGGIQARMPGMGQMMSRTSPLPPHNNIGGGNFGTPQQQQMLNSIGQGVSNPMSISNPIQGTPPSSVPGPNTSTPPPNSQHQQSTPPTPSVGVANAGSTISGITPTLDSQPQHGISNTSGVINHPPNSISTTTTPTQNLQISQVPVSQGGGRVPTPPPPGGRGGGGTANNTAGGEQVFGGGFQPGMGGKPPQQPTPGSASDPEKRKQIQQQLVLLLHAHKCQRREQEQTDPLSNSGEYTPCSLPHCKTMKNVLNHMTVCIAGRNCQYPHCASSRQIITHWKNCHRSDCPVCLPLKNANPPRTRDPRALRPPMTSASGMGPSVGPGPGMGGGPNMFKGGGFMNNPMPREQMGPVGGPMMSQVYPNTSSGMPPSMAQPTYPLPIPQICSHPTQPWHDLVNPDLRQHLVRKLVEAIYPVHDPVALQDKRVYSLIQYAMKVEKAMFDTASNREDYYKLLAQKIYHIRKELEDRKKFKKAGQVNGDPNMPPVSGNISNFFTSPPQPVQQPQQPGQMQQTPTQQMVRQQHGGTPPSSASSSGYQGSSTSSTLNTDPLLQGGGLPSANMEIKMEVKEEPPNSTSISMTNSPVPMLSSPINPPQSVPQSTSQPASQTGQMTVGKQPGALPPSSSSSSSSCGQNADPLLQGGGLSSLPSIKTEIKEEPLPSIGAPMTNSPHPPSSLENPRSSGLPSAIPSPLSVSKKVISPSSQLQQDSTQTRVENRKIIADPSLKKVFTKEELMAALMPVFVAVYNQDPESFPFRQPVDPKALGIPDYFDIIKNPIDLSTIKAKLEDGKYKNGWEFCNDMYLMFDNAWSYNRKTSRVYRYCTKLSEVFEANINDAMQSLGYCCGHRYTFHPQVLYCYGKPLCTIPRDSSYYGYQNRYVYCVKCFGEIQRDTITVGDDPLLATIIPKSHFKEMKNNSIDREMMVECIHCGRQMHTICVLHLDSIWNKGFQCANCLKALNLSRKENKYSAKRLPTTKLSTFLEDRVNNFIRSTNTAEAGYVTIRVVSSSDKVLETRTLMKERYMGEFPEQFPFRTKAMFVFEQIDGVDVCFFGMHVQEYGSDCQAPNTRRVYISYLDSVHFFRPRFLRTSVYHEILIGYLEFCKMNGFLTAHIWACPPSEGDDYIFHCHPDEQKIPKPKRLTDWYRKMLDRGKSDNVVYDYRDIFKHCTEEGIRNVTEIPYFEGDFWPNVVEETIKELDQEAKQREASENDPESRAPKKADKRSKGSKKTSTRSKSSKKGNIVVGGDDLSTKVYQTMEKHKDVFFTVLLTPPCPISSPLPGTTDPDNLISCDLMDGRDAFLTMARERHWEFSSLRRAKYSTMAMLYELHTQGGDRFVYNCNNCRMAVETRYHCRECDDFDLCVSCYKEVPHPHHMDKLGLGLELDNTQSPDLASQKDPKEQRKASIEKCIRFLVHATQCHNVHCKQPSCIKMKRVLTHTRECKLMLSGKWNQCTVCKQFVLLCISHAKSCTVDKCPVPVCARIKKNLREQKNQRQVQANRFMHLRMAQMNSALNTPSNPSGSSQPATSVASPVPSNTSPGNTINSPAAAKAKGSPAAHPSPATGPHSVGKGGPRTPAPPGKGIHSHSSPGVATPPTGKPDVGSNNMMVQASMGLPDEHTIQRVGPGPTNEFRRDTMNHMAGQGIQYGHVGMANIQTQPNPVLRGPQQMPAGPAFQQMRVPQPFGYHRTHPQAMVRQPQPNQVMRLPQPPVGPGVYHHQPQMAHAHSQAMMRQYSPQYRMTSMVGPGRIIHQPGGNQVYQTITPQQHPSQLEQILTAAPQHHPQYNPGGYMHQMGEHQHHPQYTQQPSYMPQMNTNHQSLGPPPQYPANRPQTAGYPQILGPRPGMGGAGMGGGGSYNMYQQFNSNNNNNNSIGFNSLPPQDKLSRFVEHL